MGTSNMPLSTICSKKQEEGGRKSSADILTLTLKLATSKCQLNIEVVTDKVKNGMNGAIEKVSVYSTVSILHLKNLLNAQSQINLEKDRELHIIYKKKSLEDSQFLFEAFRVALKL
jgi:hypothetical protein